jgi:hypothetical protein
LQAVCRRSDRGTCQWHRAFAEWLEGDEHAECHLVL